MEIQKLIEYLTIGHDIEFEFRGVKNSITSIPTMPDGVCLTKFYEEEYLEFENPSDLIENATIANQKVKEIIKEITSIYIY